MVLNMSARQFFTIYKEAIQQEDDERAIAYVNLCDIQSVSLATPEYFEKLRAMFYNRVSGAKQFQQKTAALNPNDPALMERMENLTLFASRLN